MKKKKIIIVTSIILIIILLIPFPMKLKDGGSTEFKSLIYTITKYNKIADSGDIKGWKVEILGVTIYDKKIPPEQETKVQYLFSFKNKYIGDASNTINLLSALNLTELSNYTIELKTAKEPYALYIDFSSRKNFSEEMIDDFKEEMRKNSIIYLALIENAFEVQYDAPFCSCLICDCVSDIIKLNIDDLFEELGDIKEYGKDIKQFQFLLNKIEYTNK